MDRSTCVSAAKWTTMSAPFTSGPATAASATSPLTNTCRSLRNTSRRFSNRPAYVSLSRFVIRQSGCVEIAQRTKLDPMNPAPPVTRTSTNGGPSSVAVIISEGPEGIRERPDAGQRERDAEPALVARHGGRKLRPAQPLVVHGDAAALRAVRGDDTLLDDVDLLHIEVNRVGAGYAPVVAPQRRRPLQEVRGGKGRELRRTGNEHGLRPGRAHLRVRRCPRPAGGVVLRGV